MTPATDFTSDASRWQALVRRDLRADGIFVYGVTTTGIYCRPTCSSRKPNRENVRFFEDWQLAEHHGFRPCRRCTPRDSKARDASFELVIRACVMIEEAAHEPTLNELANAAGLSPYHFHRIFRKAIGVTPKQYAMELRLQRLRKNLQNSRTITESIYQSGYVSNSRFYETAAKTLGMKPTTYRKGGIGMSIRYGIVRSYLGWLLVAATGHGICRIDLDDTPEALHSRLRAAFPAADLLENDPEIGTIIAQTLAFLEKPGQVLPLPLDIQGTAFQRRVWAALQDIPAGSTVSYTELAQRIGRPKAARAVARACAANRIAVAIPCHRVIRRDGDPGGYRWGLDRKKTLIQRESAGSEEMRHAILPEAGSPASARRLPQFNQEAGSIDEGQPPENGAKKQRAAH